MNTFLSRLNALFAFALSVTAAVTFACFLTTHFLDYQEDVSIEIDKIAMYVHRCSVLFVIWCWINVKLYYINFVRIMFGTSH